MKKIKRNWTLRVFVLLFLYFAIYFGLRWTVTRRPPRMTREQIVAYNLGLIYNKIQAYQDETGEYPEKLSDLITRCYFTPDSFNAICSPQGCDESKYDKHPLPEDIGTVPGPVKKITKPQDADNSYYVYYTPIANDNSIVLMTRPELLHKWKVKMIYKNGEIKTFGYPYWTENDVVKNFLSKHNIEVKKKLKKAEKESKTANH